MEWYEKLEFGENPFSTDPRNFLYTLVNMENVMDEMFYRINSGSMLVIQGKKGTGKTSLLMLAAKRFGGNKNVVYVDCKKLDKKLNITHVLQDRYGVIGRLFNRKPQDMIVLMDNVHKLSKKNTERLKYYFDHNHIKSIIFTTRSYSRSKFSDSLRDRIGKRIVKIPELTEYDAIELIERRIDDSELFNEELITKIFMIAKKSPKEMLKMCEKVAISAAKKNRKRAQMADLRVLKENKK